MNNMQIQNMNHRVIYEKYSPLLSKLVFIMVIACIIAHFIWVMNSDMLEKIFLYSKENELYILSGFMTLSYACQVYALMGDYQGNSQPAPVVIYTLINSVLLTFAVAANIDPSLTRFYFSVFLILSLSHFATKSWVVYIPIAAFNIFLGVLNNKIANLLFVSSVIVGFFSLKSLIKFFLNHPSRQLDQAFINQLFLAYSTFGGAIIYSLCLLAK